VRAAEKLHRNTTHHLRRAATEHRIRGKQVISGLTHEYYIAT
jgi:hypothetical protein